MELEPRSKSESPIALEEGGEVIVKFNFESLLLLAGFV